MQVEVEAYVVEGVGFEQVYNHSAAVRLQLADQPRTMTRTFPAGSYVVRTGQMLGRVVSHMLEPETLDNVIYWNTMDAWLPLNRLLPPRAPSAADDEAPAGPPRGAGPQDPPLVPIFKIMKPTSIPARSPVTARNSAISPGPSSGSTSGSRRDPSRSGTRSSLHPGLTIDRPPALLSWRFSPDAPAGPFSSQARRHSCDRHCHAHPAR